MECGHACAANSLSVYAAPALVFKSALSSGPEMLLPRVIDVLVYVSVALSSVL